MVPSPSLLFFWLRVITQGHLRVQLLDKGIPMTLFIKIHYVLGQGIKYMNMVPFIIYNFIEPF